MNACRETTTHFRTILLTFYAIEIDKHYLLHITYLKLNYVVYYRLII